MARDEDEEEVEEVGLERAHGSRCEVALRSAHVVPTCGGNDGSGAEEEGVKGVVDAIEVVVGVAEAAESVNTREEIIGEKD